MRDVLNGTKMAQTRGDHSQMCCFSAQDTCNSNIKVDEQLQLLAALSMPKSLHDNSQVRSLQATNNEQSTFQ
jgi:hypothetical protein